MDPERNVAQRSEVEGSGPQPNLWLVYILECEGHWLYVGLTDNLLRRWREHRQGGARFTKAHRPIHVIHVETYPTRREAEHRERQLKGWTRAKKLAIARRDLTLLKRL